MATARRQKNTGKPHKNSKWNKKEIEIIVDDMRINKLTRSAAAKKYNIGYDYLGEKMAQLNAGELK